MEVVTFKAYLLGDRTYKHLLVVRIATIDYPAIWLARHRIRDKLRFMIKLKEIQFYSFARGFSDRQCFGKKEEDNNGKHKVAV